MKAKPETGTPAGRYWWRKKGAQQSECAVRPGLGSTCPACRRAALDLDGLLRLVCPACGYAPDSGAFT